MRFYIVTGIETEQRDAIRSLHSSSKRPLFFVTLSDNIYIPHLCLPDIILCHDVCLNVELDPLLGYIPSLVELYSLQP